jgi:hypothetical protein
VSPKKSALCELFTCDLRRDVRILRARAGKDVVTLRRRPLGGGSYAGCSSDTQTFQ